MATAPIGQLAQALNAKCRGLARHLHPGWLAGLPHHGFAQTVTPVRQRGLLEASLALSALYALKWPTLAMLRPRLHRATLLERTPLLRLLALAVLHARRFEVRRWVSRALRQQVCGLVGDTAYQVLIESPDNGGAGPIGAPPPHMELDALAQAGCQLIAREGLWRARPVLTLVQLALPPQPQQQPGSPLQAQRGALEGFEQRLDQYFPEFTWLFGCDMDRALSVSKTD
jgi:Bacterial type III secretion protein (HrpB4)